MSSHFLYRAPESGEQSTDTSKVLTSANHLLRGELLKYRSLQFSVVSAPAPQLEHRPGQHKIPICHVNVFVLALL